MSLQWIHDFIDSRILDERFEVEDFTDFTAYIDSCDVPLFRDMKRPWNITFEFDENNHFKWKAIEYENEDDQHGTCVLEGNLKISKSEFPKQWIPDGLDVDSKVLEFIKSIFPKSDIEQMVPDRNVFKIDDEIVNFDTMEYDSGYIYLEFIAV
jgi:hypothetical protein